MSVREYTCVVCPNGCPLRVDVEPQRRVVLIARAADIRQPGVGLGGLLKLGGGGA